MAIVTQPVAGFVLSDVLIRDARPDDRRSIVAFMALLQDVERGMDANRTDPSEMAEPHVSALEEWCTHHEGGFLVAEYSGGVIGIVVYGIDTDFGHITPAGLRRYGLISDLVVGGNYRERGVGRRLLERAEELLTERGATRLEIKTLFENIEARAFYESRGYMPHQVTYAKAL